MRRSRIVAAMIAILCTTLSTGDGAALKASPRAAIESPPKSSTTRPWGPTQSGQGQTAPKATSRAHAADAACLQFTSVNGAPYNGGPANRYDGQPASAKGQSNCGLAPGGYTGELSGGGSTNCTLEGNDFGHFGCSVPAPPIGECISESLTVTAVNSDGQMMSSDPLAVSICSHAVRELCRCGAQPGDIGAPVDVITGALWYRRVDAQLSGPLALRLSRYYDSGFQDSQNNFNSDIGANWRTNYDGYLQTNVIGEYAIYHDAEGHIEEFWPLALGGTARDNFSGDMLSLDLGDQGYTLTTWKGDMLRFSPQGWLMGITDRYGNGQTIARDSQSGLIQSVSDPVGRQLVFSHDPSTGEITKVTTVPAGVTVSFSYTGTNCPSGNLCSATEPDGNKWSYQYDGSNELTKVIDGNGHNEETNTYTNGQVTHQEVGANQQAMTFTYSPGVTMLLDGDGNTTTFAWSAASNAVTNINGAFCKCGGGSSISYTYDAYQRVTEIKTGSQDTTYTYGRDVTNNGVVTPYPGPTQITTPLNDSSGHRVLTLGYFDPTLKQRDLVQTITEPSVDTPGKSRVVTYGYDSVGRIQSKTIVGYSAGVKTTETTTYTVNTRGQLTQVVGPRTGVTNRFVYCGDAATFAGNQLEKTVDAVGNTTIYSPSSCPGAQFDAFGNPANSKDPNGVLTDYLYDGAGRLLSSVVHNPSGPNAVTTYTYDADGAFTDKTFPLLNQVQYGYDTSERLTSITRADAAGLQHERLSYVYSNMGRETSVSGEACLMPATTCANVSWSVTQSQSFLYDSQGNLSRANQPVPSGVYNSYQFNSDGNLTYFANGNNQQTFLRGYGPQGVTTDDSETATAYLRDTQGNQTSEMVNRFGTGLVPTTYKYDDFGRPISTTSEESGTTTYAYDNAGNVRTEVQGSGSTAATTTTRTYDSLNRILTAVSTKTGAPTETVTWTYDNPTLGAYGLGRLASVADAVSGVTYDYTYDYRGLLAGQTETVGTTTYMLGYTYDGNGNPIAETYPSGLVVNQTFDYADRPSSSYSSSATFVQAATYVPFGPLSSLSFGNGSTECKTYDLRYRPVENKLVTGSTTPCQTPTTTLADYQYGEDSALNITSIHDGLNAAYNRDFTYTSIERLQNPTSGSALWGNAGHIDYQEGGDLQDITMGSAANLSFNYDLTNTTSWLTSVVDSNAGNLTYSVSHDALGNQTQVSSTNGTFNYTYSARNLLVSGDMFSYVYDGLRRRVEATRSTQTRWSFYDPAMHLIGETGINRTGQSGVVYNYIWFAGRPVAQVDNNGTHWTFVDHLGTPLIQTDSNAAITWQAEYLPNGLVFAMRGQNYHQPLRLPGMEAEQLSGDSNNIANPNGDTPRYYAGYRWFQPQWYRYTQPDPLGLAAGINIYRYADNNPIRVNDPSGLNAWDAYQTWTVGLGMNTTAAINDNIASFDRVVTHGYVGGWCAPAVTVTPEDVVNFAKFAITAPLSVIQPEVAGEEAAVLFPVGADVGFVTETASIRLSQRGLDLVGDHLAQFGEDAANSGMLQRLQEAFAVGQEVAGADANFYLHEASEATFMAKGLSYDEAHAAALAKYGVSPFSLYAPEVIEMNPTLFNNAWRAFAGLAARP